MSPLDLRGVGVVDPPEVGLGAYHPGPTASRFLLSTADIQVIRGPRGEGKTTAALYKPLFVVRTLPRAVLPLKVALIRDTYQNLLDKIIPTIRDEVRLRGLRAEGLDKLEPRVVLLGGGLVELHLFGMDTLPDANRFQGLSIGCLWIEEPAPAADLTSGVPAEALGLGVTSLRQPGVPHWVQISQNPPDEDHWTERVPETLAQMQLDRPAAHALRVERFDIPPGENDAHLPVGYRERNEQILRAIGRDDLVARLVGGKVGPVSLGPAITPEFNPALHISPNRLTMLRGVESYLFCDFGRNPSVVIVQRTPQGYLQLLASFVGVDAAMESHLQSVVVPWFMHPSRRDAAVGSVPWRIIGDPAGEQQEQSTETDAVSILLRELKFLKPTWEPGPVDPTKEIRPNAVRMVLNRMLVGRPLLRVDPGPETLPIRRALGGGWHRQVLPSGKLVEGWIKDIHSHPSEALAYGFAILFPEVLKAVERATRGDRTALDGWREARRRREAAARAQGRVRTWMGI